MIDVDKPQTPFLAASRTEGFIVGGVAIAAAALIGIFIGEDKGWIAGCGAGALAALIRVSWPLRKELWFWTAMAGFTAANVFAVEHFDWSFTHTWSGHSISALMIVDLAVMMAVIYGLFCLIYGAPAEGVADPVEAPAYSERDLDL